MKKRKNCRSANKFIDRKSAFTVVLQTQFVGKVNYYTMVHGVNVIYCPVVKAGRYYCVIYIFKANDRY